MGGEPPIFQQRNRMDFYTYCIWDFNGTILDDVELGMNSVNILLKQRGLPLISGREEYRKKFDFPIIDYYRRLGFDFEKEPYEYLAQEWVDIYMGNLHTAKIYPDLVTALSFFEDMGVKQSVLSASEKTMLMTQINGLGIKQYFEEIMGIDNIYGDSKLSLARDWKNRNPNEKVMFIGDTTHDCETAEILGADCFIVSAGHQSAEKIEGLNAKIFPSLAALVEYLGQFH